MWGKGTTNLFVELRDEILGLILERHVGYGLLLEGRVGHKDRGMDDDEVVGIRLPRKGMLQRRACTMRMERDEGNREEER